MTLIPRESWQEQVRDARDGGAGFFDLLTAVDLDGDGFELVLHLWDVADRSGVLLRTRCPRDDARFPSLVTVFGGAAWHERAAAELFGLAFDGHLTDPLLLPATFAGHPLRKDFVLASRMVKAWPGAKDPGESDADLVTGDDARPARRRPQPLGRPSGWAGPPASPREPAAASESS